MGGSISLFPWSLDAARGIRRRYYFQGRTGRIRPVPQSGDTHSSGKGGNVWIRRYMIDGGGESGKRDMLPLGSLGAVYPQNRFIFHPILV